MQGLDLAWHAGSRLNFTTKLPGFLGACLNLWLRKPALGAKEKAAKLSHTCPGLHDT